MKDRTQHAAYRDGWLAQKYGASNEGPYNPETQMASATLWDLGWTDRYSAVKHGRSNVDRLDLKYASYVE